MAGVYRWVDAHGVVHYGDSALNAAQRLDRSFIEQRQVAPAVTSDVPAAFSAHVSAECRLRRERLDGFRQAAALYGRDPLGREYRFDAFARQALLDGESEAAERFCGNGAAARLWAADPRPQFLSSPPALP